MTKPLIDSLVGDLKPVTPLSNRKLIMLGLGFIVVFAAVLAASIGLRPEYLALQNGLENAAIIWKPLIFLLLALGCLHLIADIARPAGQLKLRHSIPVALAALLFIWQVCIQISSLFSAASLGSLTHSSAFVCLASVTGGGAIAMILTWHFWLKKSATERPATLGLLWGIATGSLAAAAYSLHCNHDAMLYIGIYYCSPIILLGLLGWIMGRKLLHW